MGSEDVKYEIASRSGRLWYVVVALVLGLRTAGACTVLELTGAGFAANAVHVLHAYTLFAHNNGTMYINSTAFEYKCSSVGGWHDFFTFDGLNGTVADIASMPPGESCARYEFHDIDLMLKSLSYGWWFVDQAAAKKVWRFNDWVKDQLQPVMEELHELPAPRMAFHIRGGDKLSEDVQLARTTTRPQDFVSSLAEAKPHLKGGTCILVGDDQKWIREATELAVARFGCRPFSKTLFHVPTGGSHDQETFNHERFETKCAGTLQFILDIELLTHADYFVGTTNSGLPHVVEVLRFAVYNKDRATFVDASLQHRDWHWKMRRFWAPREGPARRLLSAQLGSARLTEPEEDHKVKGILVRDAQDGTVLEYATGSGAS